MKNKQKIFLGIIIVIVIIVIIIISTNYKKNVTSEFSANQTANNQAATQTSNTTKKNPLFYEPLTNALSRITKKPFGIYITPKTSPVQPEKFQGYHTGVDFETTPAEQKVDVPVYAVCDGILRVKEYATGYGGVAVQECRLENREVTIIYGHVRLSSIAIKVGTVLKPGTKFAVLGTGYSSETNGERKHLHLGIHIGTTINILGYVQTKSALSSWLDAKKYLE